MLFGLLTIFILELDALSVASQAADLGHCHDTADCTAWASGSNCDSQICYCPWGEVPNITSHKCEAYRPCTTDQDCTGLNLPFAGDLACNGDGTCGCASPNYILDSTGGRKCVHDFGDAGDPMEVEPSTKAETFMGMPVKVAFIVLLIFVVLLAIGVAAFGFSVWLLYQDDEYPGEVSFSEAQIKALAAARAGSKGGDHSGSNSRVAAQVHPEAKPKSSASNPKLNKAASKIAKSKMGSSKMGSKSKLDSESQAGLSAVGVSKSFQVSNNSRT